MSRISNLPCLLVLTLICLGGCGAKDGRVAISGSVELDGKPLDGATVGFVSSTGSSMSAAFTDANGKFQTRVAAGMNKVSISKADPNAAKPVAEMSDEDMLMGTDEEVAKMAVQAKGALPARYGDPKTSGLEFDIQSGMPELIIGISSN
jgi:hypothetical protein